MIEKAGIATVSVTLLPEVTRRVAPPRALAVDRPLGYPMGAPNDSEGQRRILAAALGLLTRRVDGPLVVGFEG